VASSPARDAAFCAQQASPAPSGCPCALVSSRSASFRCPP
jgi:hypothetical protein